MISTHKNFSKVICLLINLFLAWSPLAASDNLIKNDVLIAFIQSPNDFMELSLGDNFTHYGLAAFYDKNKFYILSNSQLSEIPQTGIIQLSANDQVILKRRHNLMMLKVPGARIEFLNSKIVNIDNIDLKISSIESLQPIKLHQIKLLLKDLRYNQLFFPLNKLSILIENFLLFLNSFFSNWGICIIFFAFIVKLLLYPISRAMFNSQNKVAALSAEIKPRLEEIKKRHDGEEAHFKSLDLYKELGISPNYAIYPALIALIQIPILISIFNALGEMPQLSTQNFLWISDLAKPDMISALPFYVPLLGNTMNVLPFLMAILIIISGAISLEANLSRSEQRIKKNNILLMSCIFFIIFYPFPSSMVLYWTASNFFTLAQQKIFFNQSA